MDLQVLSKEVSYALRHAPWEYELELDAEGFVPIEQLLSALNESGTYSEKVTQDHLETIIATSDKKRHEIVGGRIRALYGHSTAQKIEREAATPPDVLYHGTSRSTVSDILASGLLPMSRQYVHLSCDIDTATRVGKRRDSAPAILIIDAKRAHDAGIAFYRGNDKVWISDSVPAKYIAVL